MSTKQERELEVVEGEDGSVVVKGFEDEPAAAPGAAAAPAADKPEQEAQADPGAQDERTTTAEDHEAEDDAAAAEGRSEVEREAIRQRRREERAAKKREVREREDNLRNELAARDEIIDQMRAQLAQVTQKVTSSELAQVDAAIHQAQQAHEHFKKVMERAITAQDGATAADAAEKIGLARARAEQLQAVKNRITNPNNSNDSPIAPDPRVRQQAEQWVSKNKWFKPGATDMDNRVASAIDASVLSDGFDPRTPSYWEELDRRLAVSLPHRVKGGSITPATREKPRSPVTGSGREAASASSGSEFRLSPERVQALKEAGSWDDPKLRADGIRRFRDYDRQQAAAKRA